MKSYKNIDSNALYVLDGCLYCKFCSVQLNHSRKSLILQHLETNLHKTCVKQNNTTNLNQLYLPKKKVIDICFEGFTGANIPLHKFRDPCIIKMFKDLEIEPPSETSLRNLVDKNYEQFIAT